MNAGTIQPALAALAVLVAAAGYRWALDRPLPISAASAPSAASSRSAGPWGSLWRLGRRLSPGVAVDPAAEVLRLRSSLEGGRSLSQAFSDLACGSGPWAAEADRVCRQATAGAPLQAALDRWALQATDPAVGLLADAVAIASTTGGSLTRAIDAVLSALRDRSALDREVRALSSQARASAWVLVATPLAFAVVVAVADHRVRAFYLSTPVGGGCLIAGAVLDAFGAWWMHRLVGRVS